MKLTEAIHALADGAPAIVSVIGKRYTAEELEPKKLGEHAAVSNNVGMTAEEKRGEWLVPIPRRSSGRLYKEAIYFNIRNNLRR